MNIEELEQYKKGEVYDGTVNLDIKEKFNTLNREGFNRLENITNFESEGLTVYVKDFTNFNKLLDKEVNNNEVVQYETVDSELGYLQTIGQNTSGGLFLGVHDIEEQELSSATMEKYTATSYRFSEDIVNGTELFVSSDWFTPIAITHKHRGNIVYLPKKLFGEDKFYTIREYVEYLYNCEVELDSATINDGVLVLEVKPKTKVN